MYENLLEAMNTLVYLARRRIEYVDMLLFSLLGLDKRTANTLLLLLEKAGYVSVEKKESKEYKKCLKTAKKDKRIKNPEKYCMQKHPIDVVVKLHIDKFDELLEEWRITEPKVPIPYMLLEKLIAR